MINEHADWQPAGVKVLERNGMAAPATERPNPLRRIEWISLGEEYPGLEFKLWLNPPNPVMIPSQQLMKTDPNAGTLALLKACVLDHRDQDGQPWPHPLKDGLLPPTSADEFWEAIPDEVLEVMAIHLREHRKKVSASAERILGGFTGS